MHRINNHTVVNSKHKRQQLCGAFTPGSGSSGSTRDLSVSFGLVCLHMCERNRGAQCMCSKMCGGIRAEFLGLKGLLAYFLGTVT